MTSDQLGALKLSHTASYPNPRDLMAGPNHSGSVVNPTLIGDQVYEYLENQILTGRLQGGTRLRVRQLADVVGTSVMPVRDAINRLEEAGLAEKAVHRGAVVKTFSTHELIEIYTVRILLEVEAAREGARAVTAGGLAEMGAALTEMELALQDGRIGEAMAATSQVLRVLYRASDNNLLCSLIEALWKQSHYYRMVGAIAAHENNDNSTWDPTRQILAAARDRDPDAAALVTKESLESARERLQDVRGS